jgi:phage-related protein
MSAGSNVGQVYMDLLLNSGSFKKQLSSAVNTSVSSVSKSASKSVSSAFGKIGKVAAAAFSVKAIVNFSKACLDLGSDLAEVQNVVDVTFGEMSGEINDFAKSAIKNIGISETLAKQYTGTFGAMAKSFGFTTAEAVDMSKTLTSLSGDVASFYNLSSEEAFTKLKGVFTGETEGLKALGVVMTQSALDQYALANGFGKTTAKMTEQEKVALRYAFVQNKLSAATGDFIRTQDGWANQTRILSLQFDSFKAALGQGLINVLTPAIKVINLLMEKLVALANTFSSFTEKIFGKSEGKMSSSGISEAVTQMSELDSGTASVGDTAAKTAKKISKSLMGFDQLNTLSDNSSDSGDSSGSSSGSIGSSGPLSGGETGAINNALKETDTLFDKIIGRAKELADIFKTGFKIGLGDADFKPIFNNLKNIGSTLKEIVTDDGVKEAASNFIDTFVENIGKRVGALTSIGVTIVQNITGGISTAISNKKEDIKQWLIDMFNIKSSVDTIVSDLLVAVADIFSAFKGEAGTGITTALSEIFITAGTTVTTLAGNIGRDILDAVLSPITNNKDKIKTSVEGALGTINTVLSNLSASFTRISKNIMGVYDEHFKPLFESIKKGLTDTVGKLTTTYDTKIKPIMDKLAEKFNTVWNETIEPLIIEFQGLLGDVADAIKVFWEKAVKPFIDWLIETVWPKVAGFFGKIWEKVLDVFDRIGKVVKGAIETIRGIVQFLVGVFTGDWSKAWEGIKKIFTGVFDIILGTFGTSVEELKTKFTNMKNNITTKANELKTNLSTKFTEIKTAVTTKADEIKTGVTTAFNSAKTNAEGKITALKTNLSKKFDEIKTALTEKYEGIKTAVSNGFNAGKKVAESKISALKESLPTTLDAVKTKIGEKYTTLKNTIGKPFADAKTNVVSYITTMGTNILGKFDTLKANAKTKIEGIKTTIQTAFSGLTKAVTGIFDGIRTGAIGILEKLKTGLKTPINNILSTFNSMIDRINKLEFSLPGWVPVVGGKSLGFTIPKLPMLANGGYVKANTPQLAVIGDNKREGEIVAPESKITESVTAAMGPVIAAIQTLVGTVANGNAGGDITIPVILDGNILETVVVNAASRKNLRTGGR